MSDLLNSASLVMIPSGYKEDTVYSVVPSDGSGDLSFTRASNGTRINSAGLVEVVAWNLLPWSETFNLATGGWTLQGGAITVANSGTAPNGTNSATLLYPSVNGVIVAPNRRAEPVTAPDTAIYTQYVYAKASGKNWLALYTFNGSSGTAAWFNLSTGVVGTVRSGCTAFIESAGNGWYKCGFSQSVNSGLSLYMHIYPTDGDNTDTVTASGTNGILIWGAQLNIGSTAKPYFPTTDRLNVPRLTYQNGGGGCPSLLLEKQSTNLLTYSEQFDNADWTKANGSITANATTSPDGTTNADKFVPNTTSTDDHIVRQTKTVTSGSAYTFSVYAKNGGYNFITLVGANGSTVQVNLTSGSKTEYGSPTSTIVENIGNGWFRIAITSNASSTSYGATFNIQNSGSTQYPIYAGNGTDGVIIWGAQLEQSSYATSLINTTSSSATRVADACSKTGISSLIGQTSGSVFFDFIQEDLSSIVEGVVWYMKGTGSGERYVTALADGRLIYVENNGTTIAQITKTAFTNGRHKCAIAYATNDFVFYVDGVQIGTDTSGTPSAFSEFGLSYYISAYTATLKVNEAVIFKTRLSNSELASLTSL